MTPDLLRHYAAHGARVRYDELQNELQQLVANFPELRRLPSTPRPSTPAPNARKGHPLTAQQRRAISTRMRRYWAARRKAAKATKAPR